MGSGIPQLVNDIGLAVDVAVLLTSDIIIGANGLVNSAQQANNQGVNQAIYNGIYAGITQTPIKLQWGIYLNGVPVLQPDTVLSLEYHKESSVPDYPVEGGSFGQYNKIAKPYEARIQMAVGSNGPDGSANRAFFLDDLETLEASFDLYDIVTPEKTYLNANITGFDYRRTSGQGAGMIVADISLVEIRVSASAAFSNTAQPDGAAAQPNQVTPQPPPVNAPAASTVLGN